MQRNVELSATFFQAFNSVVCSFTGSSSQCLEAPTALNLSLMLSFYRTEGWITLGPRKAGLHWGLSQTKLSVGKCLHLEQCLRLVASVAMRAKFDVLPASILVAWYKQAGICNGWPL